MDDNSRETKLYWYQTMPTDFGRMTADNFSSGVIEATDEEIELIRQEMGKHASSQVFIRPLSEVMTTMDQLREHIYGAMLVYHNDVMQTPMCESDKAFDPFPETAEHREK